MPQSVADLESALQRETALMRICAELNHFVDLRDAMQVVIRQVQALSGCAAVSVRLRDGEDYPYFVHDGFSQTFIQRENHLCSKDRAGERIRDPESGVCELDCMCGNVIRGRTDPELPFFSTKGSFWTNDTDALLAETDEEDRQGRTRNYCNSCGFRSVALVPIRTEGEIIGLIQLNDRQPDRLSSELIDFLQMVGEQVGLAVRNSMIYSKLQQSLEEIRVLRGILPICANCKRIRDDQDHWHPLETYINQETGTQFSHGICPACQEELYPGL